MSRIVQDFQQKTRSARFHVSSQFFAVSSLLKEKLETNTRLSSLLSATITSWRRFSKHLQALHLQCNTFKLTSQSSPTPYPPSKTPTYKTYIRRSSTWHWKVAWTTIISCLHLQHDRHSHFCYEKFYTKIELLMKYVEVTNEDFRS